MSHLAGGDILQTGGSFKATVTHVATEYKWVKIYVQKDYDIVGRIEDYLERLEPSLVSKSGYMHQSQIPLGTPCFARFTDNKWYRAVCSAWPKVDATYVEVTFIDYGNPEIVSVAEVRRGDDNIFHEPPVAMECFLEGVDVGQVSPVQAAAMVEASKNALLYEEVTVVVRRYESVQPNLERPVVSILLEQGGDLTTMLAHVVQSVSTSQQPRNAALVAFHYPTIELGRAYQVYVSHGDTMGHLFLHLADRDPLEFTERIQQCYGSVVPLPESQVHQGTVCLSRFTDDGLLYRSLVISRDSRQCSLLFVDYGNSETKSLSELFIIPPELLEEPVFAVHCTFAHSSLDIDTFHQLTSENAVTCRFVSVPSPGLYQADFPDLVQPSSVASRSGSITAVRSSPPVQIRIQRISLDPGNTHAMFISWIEHQTLTMYGQLMETIQELQQTSDQVGVEFESFPAISLSDLVPGLAVACFFGCLWYRAEVVSVGSQVEVWMADYGHCAKVEPSPKYLRHLDPKYTLQPAYAVKLILDGCETLPQQSSDIYQKLAPLVLETECSVSIVRARPDGTHAVRLFTGSPPLNVLTTLQLSAAQSVERRASRLKVIPPTLNPVERILVMNIWPPNKLFGQLCRIPEEEMDSLQAALNSYYGQLPVDPVFRPRIGQHVVCRFSEDGLFYRARVTQVDPDGRFKVFYLDFGNEESVSLDDIRELTCQYSEMTQLGIECALQGSEVNDSMLDTEMEVHFLDCSDRYEGMADTVHKVTLRGSGRGSGSSGLFPSFWRKSFLVACSSI